VSKRRRGARSRARGRPLLAALAAGILVAAAWWLVAGPGSPLASTNTGGPTNAGGSGSFASFRPPDLHALAVAPDDERTLIFGHHQGMLVSRDAGATWSRISGASGDAMGIALPAGSRTAYVAGHNVFFRSDDGGTTWRSVRPSLPGLDIHGFAASAAEARTFYAFVVGHGLFRSDDVGTTWARTGDAPGSTMSMAAGKSGGKDVLFAATMDAGVVRSRDGGRSWERVPELGRAGHASAAGDVIYAAGGSSVLVSQDGGGTWQRRPFPRGGAVLVAVAPSDTRRAYVVTDRLEVWRSRDGGESWERAG
jgi:photosystem II stability/assembly factor-like uncharacterized protein